jgi:transcriptional regulator with GAF, ATPase, and Fis domain
MSREHARLRPTPAGWELLDLHSRNGSWLDQTRITAPTLLPPGTTFRLGDSLFHLAPCAPEDFEPTHLVGVSAEICAIRSSIRTIARTTTSVLITGETGTGKEMVAQELHARSGRKGRLVSLNCAAIPEGLLASELFGHTRGAFTGASDARDGLFRAADGGTLFLDEIGEMPLALQVQLLRVLETRMVRPVGSTRDVPVDVRIVAATNRDLPAALQENSFRPDLYVRLAQWQVRLPPLRERRADIPFLARALLERRGASGRRMTMELMGALLEHSWPFNVRGLLNALTAADIGSPADGPLSLCPEVSRIFETEQAIVGTPRPTQEPTTAASLGGPPRSVLVATLAEVHGRVAEAARRLGCTRQQLYRWIAAHQIDVDKLRDP